VKNQVKFIVWGLVVAVLGCGGEDKGSGTVARPGASGGASEEPTAVAETNAGEKPWDPALGTATISGVVKFDGKPPRRRPISFGAKKECADIHTTPLLDESIIVNANGSLKNVFISVKKGLEEWKFPVPTEPVVMNQVGYTFTPHVLGVQAGQPITIRNSDPFTHNVHSFPARNKSFNFGQTKQGQEDTRTFTLPETNMFKVKCEIHTWMLCNVCVVNHPFFMFTGDDGAFRLEGMPPGEFTIEAQHEEFKKQSKKVTVGDKDSQSIEFTFKE
jgi:plastocyanin